MEHALLVGFIFCSSCGILLSIPLLFLNTRNSKSNLALAKNSRFETYLALVFGMIQIGLLAAVCAAAVKSLNRSQQVRWMDAACFSTLQICAGVNLARVLHHLSLLPWAAPLAYALLTVSAALDFAYLAIQGRLPDYRFFFYLMIPSLLALAVPCRLAYQHKSAGGKNQKFLWFLILLAISNTISALSQFCGAIIIYRFLLVGREITSKMYYGILLNCTFAHLLCPLVFCISGVRPIMEWAWTQMQSHHLTGTDTEGAVRLDSLRSGFDT